MCKTDDCKISSFPTKQYSVQLVTKTKNPMHMKAPEFRRENNVP